MTIKNSPKITIIGAGAWGSAIASVLANNGHEVLLYCNENIFIDGINKNNISPRLPCLLYTSPSPRDRTRSRMPSSA